MPVVAPGLIRVQPNRTVVVVAIGAALRVFDTSSQQPVRLTDATTPGRHGDVVRAIAFDSSGRLFASAGDDKLVKVWDATSWACMRTWRAGKKVSALAFSHDGRWLLFADKFGIVYVLPTSAPPGKEGEASQLLAHCCSIITCLASSHDGHLIASGDRDFKIRVSVFPPEPLGGAPEIESFCLGHRLFVTCVAFVGPTPARPAGLLLSGGGDGTVRLWDPVSGQQLCSVAILPAWGGEASYIGVGGEGEEPQSPKTVVAMAIGPDQRTIAVAVESLEEVFLLDCEPSGAQLMMKQRVHLEDIGPPSSLAFGDHGSLWLLSGAAEALETDDHVVTAEAAAAYEKRAHEIADAAVARVKVLRRRNGMVGSLAPAHACTAEEAHESSIVPTLSCGVESAVQPPEEATSQSLPVSSTEGANLDNGGGVSGTSCQGDERDPEGPLYCLIPDDEVPGGAKLLETLQGKRQCATVWAGSLVKEAEQAMKSALSKREYTQEERDFRKRMRNDHRLEMLAAKADGNLV